MNRTRGSAGEILTGGIDMVDCLICSSPLLAEGRKRANEFAAVTRRVEKSGNYEGIATRLKSSNASYTAMRSSS
jgi:hypothetical protein